MRLSGPVKLNFCFTALSPTALPVWTSRTNRGAEVNSTRTVLIPAASIRRWGPAAKFAAGVPGNPDLPQAPGAFVIGKRLPFENYSGAFYYASSNSTIPPAPAINACSYSAMSQPGNGEVRESRRRSRPMRRASGSSLCRQPDLHFTSLRGCLRRADLPKVHPPEMIL